MTQSLKNTPQNYKKFSENVKKPAKNHNETYLYITFGKLGSSIRNIGMNAEIIMV